MSDSNNAMKDDVSAFDKGLEEWDSSAFDRGMQDYDLEQKRVEASQPDTLDDFLTGAVQGATFGFSDEIGAAIDILRGRAPADAKTLTEAYRVLQKAREAENEAARERSPMATTAGELIGGFAVPIPGAAATGLGKAMGLEKLLATIGFKGKMLGHATSGTAAGMLAGLGTSKGAIEEDPTQILKDVGITGAIGGGLGIGLGTAADKVKGAWEKFINTPGGKKMVASFEMAAGKRPGYEGEQVVSMETPSIHPEKPESGHQKIITKRIQLADELTEDAVNMQAKAKEQLNAAIDRNKGVPSRPQILPEDVANQIHRSAGIESYDRAYSYIGTQLNQAEKALLSKELKRRIAYNTALDEVLEKSNMSLDDFNALRKQKGQQPRYKLDTEGNNMLSWILEKSPRLNDLFGEFNNRESTKILIDKIQNFAKNANDPNFNAYADNLIELIKIADSKPGNVLHPIREILYSIDPNFINNLKSNPLNIKIDELFKFRRNFLRNANSEAIEKNLNNQGREILFGIKDPTTGKYDGGVFNAIEGVLKNSSEDLKSIINNVDKKSRHIEVLLNAHPDQRFHGTKAWDFDRPEDLRRTLQESFSKSIEKARSGTMQGAEEATLLRNYFKTMLDNASSSEERKLLLDKINILEEKVGARSEEIGSMMERVGVDPTEGIKAGKFDASTIPAQAKQSNITKLAELAGVMKRSVEKTAEEIPAIVRVPVREGLKLPFTFKNATEEQLKKAGEILRASNIPSVKQFGEGIAESATNNPAVRNAIIHSAYQKEEIRKALGLTLNSEDEKKK